MQWCKYLRHCLRDMYKNVIWSGELFFAGFLVAGWVWHRQREHYRCKCMISTVSTCICPTSPGKSHCKSILGYSNWSLVTIFRKFAYFPIYRLQVTGSKSQHIWEVFNLQHRHCYNIDIALLNYLLYGTKNTKWGNIFSWKFILPVHSHRFEEHISRCT